MTSCSVANTVVTMSRPITSVATCNRLSASNMAQQSQCMAHMNHQNVINSYNSTWQPRLQDNTIVQDVQAVISEPHLQTSTNWAGWLINNTSIGHSCRNVFTVG